MIAPRRCPTPPYDGRMRVAFIAAECEPWAKTGGLGDVVDALARAMGRIPDGPDQPIDVWLPRYRSVPVPEDRVLARRVLAVAGGGSAGEDVDVTIVDVAADGYRLRLVEFAAAYDRLAFYGDAAGDFPDNAWRFTLLCRSALETIRAEGGSIDLLHLHDWHTGPALLLRDGPLAGAPEIDGMASLLTLHNLAYHGWVPPDRVWELGISGAGGIDLLREGIERAELVNTVSPGFATEALTPSFGMGLDSALQARGDRFFGILNGIDPVVWDPAHDAVLIAPYDRIDRFGKADCRAALLRRVGFEGNDDGPVLAMIGRLDPQKGFDLLAGAAPGLLDMGARLIVLGSGDPALAGPFRGLAHDQPSRVALLETFDRDLARQIYAGADIYVMPSRFEPCGQGQMIALRYGTPPIVRRTGGLADTVSDVDEHPDAGTGFVFGDATSDALLGACGRAIALRRDHPESWNRLTDRGMAVDFGWEGGSAQRYLAAYERAIALRHSVQGAGASGPPLSFRS